MKNFLMIMLLFVILVGSAFGESDSTLMDVHGAGAQRSDPKSGDPGDYPQGHGPQGDVIRIFNYVRLVRSDSGISNDYSIVDTNQTVFFNNKKEIKKPSSGEAFYGQDAGYSGLQPAYNDNGDGTILDKNTGLMWQQDAGEKMTYSEALKLVDNLNPGGYDDWRLPTVKELYSLIIFSGRDISIGMKSGSAAKYIPFIDTNYFAFEYGDTSKGEREIDSQYMSSTKYVHTTMGGNETVFGVNFADGRIKGYPIENLMKGDEKEFFVIFVRGNTLYGKNDLQNNGDGTVTDKATGLMWLQNDSGSFDAGKDGAMPWEDALEWAENLDYAGYSDWRLPNAKELQSLVDYSRSPATTNSPAIDPVFTSTVIKDEGDNDNYPFYWTSTTHSNSDDDGKNAAYLAFGEALGFMGQMQGGPGGAQGGQGGMQGGPGGSRPPQGQGPGNQGPPLPPPRN